MPLGQRQQTYAKSQSGNGSRKTPRSAQPKRAKRSTEHGQSVAKSTSSAKSRPSSSAPQFSTTRVDQTLRVLERLYGTTAEQRRTFEDVVIRPTEEAIGLIVANDWSAIEVVVGCVAQHDRAALIKAAIALKQHENREAAAQKRDIGRKRQRSEKPDPIRRSSRTKPSVPQRT